MLELLQVLTHLQSGNSRAFIFWGKVRHIDKGGVLNMRYLLAAIILALTFWSMPAEAQATRTWVSGVGDDANPCSRTAPCKTFAGAISKTAAAGEINCLDPGGFGALTITKSITIDCAGTLGSTLASQTNGFIVNAPGGKVVLRNLSINGAATGLVGVRLIAAETLHISDVNIGGFETANGVGIYVEGSTAKVFVRHSNILQNQSGIKVQSAASATLMVSDSSITSNKGAAVAVEGIQNRVFVSNSVIFGNGAAFNATNGGSILSYGDNRVDGNTSAEKFSGPVVRR